MKTLHAYWMAPLRPSQTQRTAQTMCKLKLTPTSIAVDDEPITCPVCVTEMEAAITRAENRMPHAQGDVQVHALHSLIVKMTRLLPAGNELKRKYAEVNRKVK